MAETDDVVFVDTAKCRCGRHTAFEEPGLNSEEPYRPKPGPKPNRFKAKVPDYALPKDEQEACKCNNKKGLDALDALLGASDLFGNMQFTQIGSGFDREEKKGERAKNNHFYGLPPQVTPAKIHRYAPPPPPSPPPIAAPPPPSAPISGLDPLHPPWRSSGSRNRPRRSGSIDPYDTSSEESEIVPRGR